LRGCGSFIFIERARAIVESNAQIGVRDAVHAAVMLNRGITKIATFDKAFDRIEGVERIALA